MYLFWYLYLHAYVQINKFLIVYMYVHVVVVNVQLNWLEKSILTSRNFMLCDHFVSQFGIKVKEYPTNPITLEPGYFNNFDCSQIDVVDCC